MAIINLTTGTDNLTGTASNDTFNSTYIDGASGTTFNISDVLNGGAGVDSLIVETNHVAAITPVDGYWSDLNNIEKVVIHGGAGAQTITTAGAFEASFAAKGVDFTTTSDAGAITIDMGSFTGTTVITTESTGGAQTITTGIGNTTVTANSTGGAQTITGPGLSVVTATSTHGAQTITGVNLTSVTATSFDGAQTITGSHIFAVNAHTAGAQTITMGSTANVVTASSSALSNLIMTNAGDDVISVATSTGKYKINAGVGKDLITGGAGDDRLIGGRGADTLHGGAGADTFVYNAISDSGVKAATRDVVTDFAHSEGDKIDVSAIDANVNVGGAQHFTYINEAAFSAAGQVRFDAASHQLSFNTNGDATTTEMSIQLDGVTAFQLSDLILNKSGMSSLLLEGDTGENLLTGGSGDDVLNGYTGNDILFDLQGNNKLFGGTDNDTLTTGAGADWLDGGTGNDALTAGAGNDWLDAGTGSDMLDAGAGNDTLYGGTGDDVLMAGTGNDFLDGGTGDDRLIGGAGADTLLGGTGADTFVFGSGANQSEDIILDFNSVDGDRIDISGINANLNALAGANQHFSFINADAFTAAGQVRFDAASQVLSFNNNADTTADFSVKLDGVTNLQASDFITNKSGMSNIMLEGDTGANTLTGGSGDDVLNGYTGNDVLFDLQGNNKLFGGTDNDTLTTGAGADWLDGGTGNDALTAGAGNDWLDAGTGSDMLDAGAGNDTLYGNTGDDVLVAGTGNDFLDGGTGDDRLIGGAGADTLLGGTGADTFVFGSSGNQNEDTILDFNSVDGDRIDISGINANLNALAGANQHFSFINADAFTAAGQVRFDAVSQVLSFNNNADTTADFSVTLAGVTALQASDFITNKSGVASLMLEGDTGENTLTGGAGDDVLNGYTGNDVLIDLQGNNKLFGGTDNDTLTTGVGADWLDGGTGNDVLTAGAGNDWLDAGTGSDILYAGAGNDSVYGNTGDDLIYGNAGNDFIDGGTGVDFLIGGAGVETLTGGTGADIFVYQTTSDSGATTATRDIILDFVHSDGDKVDVSVIDADVNATGSQNFTYINTGGFSAAGQISFDNVNNVLSFNTDADTSTVEMSIQLTGITTFQVSDLLF